MPTEKTKQPGILKVTGTYTTHFKVTIDVGTDPVTGKRRQRSKTFPTFDEARDWQIQQEHKKRERTYIEPSDQPLGEYLGEWLATLRKPAPITRASYADDLKRITARLGAVPLGKLTPAHIDRLIADLLDAGYAPGTVNRTLGLVKRALKRAVRRGLILSNPTEDADLPSNRRAPLDIWSGEQVRHFLRGTTDDRYHALWHLALTTGMRQGEMLALAWDAVDLDRGTLTVERHLSDDAQGKLIIVSLAKTDAGYRQLALPPSAVGALRVHHYHQTERREVLGKAWCDEGLVFDRHDGRLMRPYVLATRHKRLSTALGLPRIRFHDLRHSAASMMLTEVRLPLFVVSRILGHSSIQVTANLYGHLLEDAQRAAAADVERTLWGLPDLGL